VKIDVVYSEAHYARHLLPIWAALPDELRGDVHPMYPQGAAQRPPMGRWALVAGWQDVSPLRGQCNMIYVEHGAGQTYQDRPYDPSYSASRGQRHRGVRGYIAPSQTVADRWDAPSAAVGCPKMDRWILDPPPKHDAPTVCFAWHWDCRLVPEARSAWPHYEPMFGMIREAFADQGFAVVGHEHPKWRGKMNRVLGERGIPTLSTEEEVFALADILVVDNSSLAYEFALLGKPVICLNAPWYRRDVEHGLRFWSHVPGIQIDDPWELATLNLWDLIYDTELRAASEAHRLAAVEHAYAVRDGSSSGRAAAFIATTIDGK
jgi:hypothetical protein